MDKINILGTEYTIQVDDSLNNTNADGLCKQYEKKIAVRPISCMLCDDDSESVKRLRFNEVLRHEVIHAFFNEAGLADYSSDEQLVNWIAVQFPKMAKIFVDRGWL